MLKSTLWEDDIVEGKIPKYTTATSEALLNRNKWITGSKVCNFVTELHCDVLKCSRLLPPDIDIKFKFIRNPSTFGVISTAQNYKVQLLHEGFKLEMRKISCKAEIVRNYEANLLKKSAYLPFTMTKIKTYIIASGTSHYMQANINGVGARLPRQLIFGFLSTRSLSGACQHSPFHFYHWDFNQFSLRVC